MESKSSQNRTAKKSASGIYIYSLKMLETFQQLGLLTNEKDEEFVAVIVTTFWTWLLISGDIKKRHKDTRKV